MMDLWIADIRPFRHADYLPGAKSNTSMKLYCLLVVTEASVIAAVSLLSGVWWRMKEWR